MDVYHVYCAITSSYPQRLLDVPVPDASRHSAKPLKWLVYAAGTVLGTHGELQPFDAGEQILNLDEEQPTCRNLLFIPSSDIIFIDHHGLDHLTSSSSQGTTESRIHFRDELKERDRTCVVTGHHPIQCHGAHLIPHSKGSQYIQRVCRLRTGSETPQIETVNDIQNGILLTASIHANFDHHILAILRTPNFAMSTQDALPLLAEPNTPFRFTPTWFVPDDAGDGDWFTPHQDMRYPPNLDGDWPEDWPPDFLWDFIYGVVMVKKYGFKETLDVVSEESDSLYYEPGTVKTATERARADLAQSKLEYQQKVQEQQASRDQRAEQRGGGSQRQMDAYDQVLCLWTHYRYGPLGQERHAKEEAVFLEAEQEKRRLKANEVTAWRKEVEKAIN